MKEDDSIAVAQGSQLSTDLGGEFVILGLTDEVYYGVDEVGARIWELIQEPRTVSFLVQTIVSEYDVDPAVCAADITAFVEELSARSLVEVRPAGA